MHVDLPGAEPPRNAVLFFNPRSGGGKAERFALADEARARGIEPIEPKPGDHLEALVRGAVERWRRRARDRRRRRSQAIVAAIAAERGPPYASSPPARAITSRSTSASIATMSSAPSTPLSTAASVSSILAAINDRVFVNNVSLGLYAEAVQRDGYRDAKLRTLLDTVPDVIGPEGGSSTCAGAGLGPRLGRAMGSGTRPRIDDGLLGVTLPDAREAVLDRRRLLDRGRAGRTAPSKSTGRRCASATPSCSRTCRAARSRRSRSGS